MIRQKDGSNSHNLFGIKATNWSGESAAARTTEYVNGRAVKQVEGFRAYASFEQSFDDFVSLLQNSDRYQSAVNAGGDSERFVRELQKAGYATDPQYARKVSQIARRMEAYHQLPLNLQRLIIHVRKIFASHKLLYQFLPLHF